MGCTGCRQGAHSSWGAQLYAGCGSAVSDVIDLCFPQRVGVYNQHAAEQLELSESPVEYLIVCLSILQFVRPSVFLSVCKHLPAYDNNIYIYISSLSSRAAQVQCGLPVLSSYSRSVRTGRACSHHQDAGPVWWAESTGGVCRALSHGTGRASHGKCG